MTLLHVDRLPSAVSKQQVESDIPDEQRIILQPGVGHLSPSAEMLVRSDRNAIMIFIMLEDEFGQGWGV